MTLADLCIFTGAGCLWMGWLVLANGGLPRQLRRGEVPRAEKGTEAAFRLFWMDQYSWFGIGLLAGGGLLAAAGLANLIT